MRWQHRRYALDFRRPLRTGGGVWTRREGLLVRVTTEDERGVGWGEAAPVPAFGMESVEELDAAARSLPREFDGGSLPAVPARLPTLAQALATAAAEAGERGGPGAQPGPATLQVAALLPAGKAALPVAAERLEAGFRVLKWKVGAGDWREEVGLMDELCAALPEGARLRLDANGGWDRRTAERWLERAAERPVEFVEQPVGAGLERERADDLLRGLAADFPTPLALDESLVGEGDLERWLGSGWPGVFVVKPSLFAAPRAALEKLRQADARVVFSSAIETAVGARAALRLAFAFGGEKPAAVGFGVWPIFADSRFDGPAAAPFIRRADLEAINPEARWNALS